MKINKIYRLCMSAIVFFGSIVLSMVLLQVPFIKNLLAPSNIYSISGI